MSNEENPQNPHELPPEQGGWQPIPHGEYDAEATGFFQFPAEGALDTAPLEAPGHGYVPPVITPLEPAEVTDPAATGVWQTEQPGTRWPEPAPYADPVGQWTYADEYPAEHAAEPVQAAVELTGQWTIPVAGGDLPEESGEFTASALKSEWEAAAPPAPWAPSADAPATLPGGAVAPWATVREEPAERTEPEEPAELEAPAEPESEPEPAEQEMAPEAAPEPEAARLTSSSTGSDEHPPSSYVLRVNGTDRPVTDAWIGESLLYVLRERLGLAGAKDGCSQGECGACNVQVDGRLVASCLVPAAIAAGSEVRTVEGLATDGEPSDVQRALASCGAVQCGFCIPGMAMTVHDLLEGNHAPTELQTRQALCGNLCRCSGYRGVLDAVREVVAERAASASAAAETSEEARIPHQALPGAGSVQPHPHDGGMA
ncbi:(2Fe-2S)-binding protein [Streptomyces sp. NPDC052236]|uniref:(2Fe-2S)-binding protein n=1 Tax=Streptomyces sp. NPDC052236 TaxID=3365686 RepID=UPI0037CF19EB